MSYVVNRTWYLSVSLDAWCLSVGLDAWCLSDSLNAWRLSGGLDVIYIQKSMLINCYTQSQTLTN